MRPVDLFAVGNMCRALPVHDSFINLTYFQGPLQSQRSWGGKRTFFFSQQIYDLTQVRVCLFLQGKVIFSQQISDLIEIKVCLFLKGKSNIFSVMLGLLCVMQGSPHRSFLTSTSSIFKQPSLTC